MHKFRGLVMSQRVLLALTQAGVSREEVQKGVELIGLERSEHIQNVIDGLRSVAAELGIRREDLAG